MPATLTWRTITDEVFTQSKSQTYASRSLLREDVLPEIGWTQTEFATRLMVSRQTVSDLLHEKKSVTAEMAIRIARAVGGTPESWLRMQEALDLWAAEMKFKNKPKLAPRAMVA